jgi:trigger factor
LTEPLTITTSPRDDHQLDLTIQLGPERTEAALQRAAKQVAKRANVPGFRKGHAPYSAVVRAYGRESLLNEVLDALGQEVYSEALETEQIEPYAQAALVNVEMDPLAFKLTVPLDPTVDLGDYHTLRCEEPQVNVTEADVDKVIEGRRDQLATWVDIERAAEIGDMVVVDIKGDVGEDSIMDNRDWEINLKDESGWLPGFDQAFVGMAAGDEKDFALTYPEDSTSRYKGQEATFHATVKTIRAHVQPETNDEWAKGQGDYQDLADLRAKLLASLTEQARAEAQSKLNDDAIRALIEHAPQMDYPPVVVDEGVEEMLHDLEHRLSDIGYKLDDYLKLQGTNAAEYRLRIRSQAEGRAKGRLVVSALARDEKIEVTPEEISARIEKMIPLGVDDNPEAKNLREVLTGERGQEMIRQELLSEKTLARLREIVTGKAIESEGEVAEPATTEAIESEGEVAESAITEAPVAEQGTAAPDTDTAGQEEGEPSVENQ